MKKEKLLIISIIVVIIGILISILFLKFNKNNDEPQNPKENNTNVEKTNNINGDWTTYKIEYYMEEEIVDRVDINNYTLNINQDSIILCYIVNNICENITYNQRNNQFIVVSRDNKLFEGTIEILYEEDLKIIQTFTGGSKTIYYFTNY